MTTLEELQSRKRPRFRVVCASMSSEKKARMSYPAIGDEKVRQLKRDGRTVAKQIMGYMDSTRSGQKVHA